MACSSSMWRGIRGGLKSEYMGSQMKILLYKNMILRLIATATLAILVTTTLPAATADQSDMYDNYYSKTTDYPSKEILEAIAINDFEITSKICINVDHRLPRKETLRECEYAYSISLRALGAIPNVDSMIAALEGSTIGKARVLGEVRNLGGLSDTQAYLSLRVKVPELNGRVGTIWVFMKTSERTFANAAQVRCQHVVH